MKESKRTYIMQDEDGDKTKYVVTSRVCGCMADGCVDNDIEIEDWDSEVKITLSHSQLPLIEGLLDGSLKPPEYYES